MFLSSVPVAFSSQLTAPRGKPPWLPRRSVILIFYLSVFLCLTRACTCLTLFTVASWTLQFSSKLHWQSDYIYSYFYCVIYNVSNSTLIFLYNTEYCLSLYPHIITRESLSILLVLVELYIMWKQILFSEILFDQPRDVFRRCQLHPLQSSPYNSRHYGTSFGIVDISEVGFQGGMTSRWLCQTDRGNCRRALPTCIQSSNNYQD